MKPDLRERILRYLDGVTSEIEEKELASEIRSDDEAKKLFADLMSFEGVLVDTLREAKASQKIVRAPAKSETIFDRISGIFAQLRASYVIPLSVAALVIFLIGLMFFTKAELPVIANIAEVKGTVAANNQGKIWRTGVKVIVGDRILTGTDGWVKLAMNDGSSIVVHENTVLDTQSWKLEGKRELRMEKGQISCSIVKQEEEKPLVVRTLQAEMKVVGTRFDVRANTNSSRLEVAEGEVRLQAEEGNAVMVRAGFEATVGPDTSMNPHLIGANQKLGANVVFFRDFEDIYPGEKSPNTLVPLNESGREITTLVSKAAKGSVTFRPDVEIRLGRFLSSSKPRAEVLYVIPKDPEIRIRIKSEHPGKIGIAQIPTNIKFKAEHFYAAEFDVDKNWKEIVLRSSDVRPYMTEGPSRDFVPGVEIGFFVIYGFGTGELYLDQFTVASAANEKK
jgi:hypothetical protein